jgi:hypothetical protein
MRRLKKSCTERTRAASRLYLSATAGSPAAIGLPYLIAALPDFPPARGAFTPSNAKHDGATPAAAVVEVRGSLPARMA